METDKSRQAQASNGDEMQPMTKADFLATVKKNEKELVPDGAAFARAIALHLPEDIKVLTLIWLLAEPDPRKTSQLAIVAERYFILAEAGRIGSSRSAKVESVSMSRLRAVNTVEWDGGASGQGGGELTLDFANPVFDNFDGVRDSSITLEVHGEWPSTQVESFLTAIAKARR